MAKKKSKRISKDVNAGSREITFTDDGFEFTDEQARSVAGTTGNAVHAPQLMALSNQLMTPRRGTRELLRLYGQSPWLRAIVGKISRAVAETDWVLYAKRNASGRYVEPNGILRKNGELFERRLMKEINNGLVSTLDDHPFLDFLERGTGNPRLNGFGCMQITQEHFDLVGEAFWLIESDQLGVPYAYWPIPPSWVNSFPTEENPFYEINAPGGVQVKVPITMICPFIDPDPENPYGRGIGNAKALDDEIQIDEFAAKHQKSFFLNRARPDLIISGQFISPKDAQRLESQWRSDHQGFWKAFKPLFFSQKIDVKELTQTFESMQMVQIRKHERDTFINVFGAPPEKFGIIGESKRSTIQAADYFWNKDLIKPRVETLRRVIQQVIIPRFDERLLLHYDTPVIQDDEFRLNVMRQAPFSVTVNEWRKEQGREPLGITGEVLMVPLNHRVVPIKDDNGNPVKPSELVQEQERQLALPGYTNPIEIETNTIVEEICSELREVLVSEFSRLERSGGE